MTKSSDDPKTRPFSIITSFNTAAQWTSRQCGRASTFAVACALIDLDAAGAEIEGARDKVSAVAAGKAARPGR